MAAAVSPDGSDRSARWLPAQPRHVQRVHPAVRRGHRWLHLEGGQSGAAVWSAQRGRDRLPAEGAGR